LADWLPILGEVWHLQMFWRGDEIVPTVGA
jgi:hypothetical protein